MKCPNCGGEVDSQSVLCPFCNSEYEPGKLFQIELEEKIARNKLLPKKIIKNRTPEMISMLLTRVIISASLFAVLFTAVAYGVFVLGENGLVREPKEGSYAWKYAKEADRRIENEMLREYMYDIVIAIDTGGEVRDYWIDYVLSNAYYPLREDPDSRESQIIKAFMTGYLQMSEEEIGKVAAEYDSYETKRTAREQLVYDLLRRVGGGE